MLAEQFSSEHLLITDVQVFFTPVPDFPPGDLPFGGAGIKRRNARVPCKLSPNCKHVCVTARQVQLPYIYRQAEGDVEGKLIL